MKSSESESPKEETMYFGNKDGSYPWILYGTNIELQTLYIEASHTVNLDNLEKGASVYIREK